MKFLKDFFSSLTKDFLIKTLLPNATVALLPFAASLWAFRENIYIGIITAIGFLAIAGLLSVHISKIKQLFLSQNSIENKLLILDNILLNHDEKNNTFNLRFSLHNCSNQIIDIELDLKKTRAIINKSTHEDFKKNTTLIPPYSSFQIIFLQIPTATNVNILDISIEAHILYGSHGGGKTYSVSKSFKQKIPISLFPKNKI